MRPIRDLPAPACSRAVRAVLLSLASDFAAPFFGQSAADGARPILFAATSPEGKAGRLLWTRRNWRIARRAGARADHAPGARRGKRPPDFGTFPRNSQRRLSIDGRADATGKERHRRRTFDEQSGADACGSGSRMPPFASIMCCRFAAGRNNTGTTSKARSSSSTITRSRCRTQHRAATAN